MRYPTNLTDKQWKVSKNVIEIKERKRKHSLREMINAIMYLTKTGCQPVANASKRFRSLANGILLFPQMEV